MSESTSWKSESPALDAAQWTTAWSGQGGAAHICVEWTPCSGTDGAYRLHRVRTGTIVGAGTVVVLTRRENGITSVLLVRQNRPAPGVVLWELPRGSADLADRDELDTGRRELAEETGIQITGGRLVGMLYPDSGLLASKVGVMSAELSEEQRAFPNDGEVDEVEWFTLQDLGNMVAAGTLRDGISLSALLMASVWAGNPVAL